jgi:uncharacterized membrane protein
MNKKKIFTLYLLSCLVGTLFEFTIGWIIRFVTGHFLWIYPISPLQTTAWQVIPLWGLGGLISYAITKKIDKYYNK